MTESTQSPEANYRGWGSGPHICCLCLLLQGARSSFKRDICLSQKCSACRAGDKRGKHREVHFYTQRVGISPGDLRKPEPSRWPHQTRHQGDASESVCGDVCQYHTEIRGVMFSSIFSSYFCSRPWIEKVLSRCRLQAEWILIHFPSSRPFSVKVGSIKFDGKLK